MWFWSVSWSTNCPVYFSLFLVDQKKICSVSENFWSASDFFGPPSFFLVYQNFFLVYQKIRAWPKKIQRLTKNSLRLNKFFLVDQKKWEIDRTIGRPRDWPKPHGRDSSRLMWGQILTFFCWVSLTRNSDIISADLKHISVTTQTCLWYDACHNITLKSSYVLF